MLLMMAILTAMAQDTAIDAKTMTSAQAGSLWADGRTRMLVGMEGNARMVGDLITVTISERTSTSLVAGTLTTRNSQMTAGVGSVFGLEQKLFALYPELGGKIEMDSTAGADFRGDGTTTREGALQGTLTCKVVEVRPNGNLVVLGWKEVRSNKETQYLSLSGMVRPQDIQSNNTIPSDLIAEARIEYTGAGVVADKQAPGIGVRAMDHVWPF